MRMNRVSAVVIAVVVFVLQLGAPAAARGAGVGGEADFGEFSAALAPYGRWLEVAGHGTCWSPDVEPHWAPYTDGYWAYTDAGWTWVSREPFGSIVFHYGRWLMTSEGWCWVPGQDWGPAWVSWRTGDKYVGWAPLPPEVPWNAKRGIGSWVDVQSDIGPGYYRFCMVEDFGSPYMREVVFPVARNTGVFVTTRNVTHITVHEETIFCAGPSYGWVSSRCVQPVPTLRLVREPSFNVFVSYGTGLGFAGFIARDCLFLPAPVRVCKPQPHHFAVAPVPVQRQTTRGWSADRQEVRDVSKYVSHEWEKQRTTLTAKTQTPAGGPAVLNEMRFAPRPVSEQEKRLVLEGEHPKTPLHSIHSQTLPPASQTTQNIANTQDPKVNSPQPGAAPAASSNAVAPQQSPSQTLKTNGPEIVSNPAPASIPGVRPEPAPAASAANPATRPSAAPATVLQSGGQFTTRGSTISGSGRLASGGSQKASTGSSTTTSGSHNAVLSEGGLLEGAPNTAPPAQGLRSSPALRDPFAGSGFVPPVQTSTRPAASSATATPVAGPAAPPAGAAAKTATPAAPPAVLLAPAPVSEAPVAVKSVVPTAPIAPIAPTPIEIPVAAPKPVKSMAPVMIKSGGVPSGSSMPPPAPIADSITSPSRTIQTERAPAQGSSGSKASSFSAQTGQPSTQIISTTEIGRPPASSAQPVKTTRSALPVGVGSPQGFVSQQGFASPQGSVLPQTSRQESGRTTVPASPVGSTGASPPMGAGTSTRQAQSGVQQSLIIPQSTSRQTVPAQPANPVPASSGARSGISVPVQSSVSFGGGKPVGGSSAQAGSPAPPPPATRPGTTNAAPSTSTSTTSSSKSKTTDPNAPKP